MSRSRKKPIIKQARRNYKKSSPYWRTVRRVINERIKYLSEQLEEKNIPNPKQIINDYDYSDYRFDYRYINDEEITKKESRK